MTRGMTLFCPKDEFSSLLPKGVAMIERVAMIADVVWRIESGQCEG